MDGDLAWWLILCAEERDAGRIPPSWDEWVRQKSGHGGGGAPLPLTNPTAAVCVRGAATVICE